VSGLPGLVYAVPSHLCAVLFDESDPPNREVEEPGVRTVQAM
jgi:hypothetical protein